MSQRPEALRASPSGGARTGPAARPGPGARIPRSVYRRLARAGKAVLLLLGVYGLLRRLHPASCPTILRFHSVAGEEGLEYASRGIAVTPRVFRRQVRYLSRNYRVIDMDRLHAWLTAGGGLQPDTLVFTFDDGYLDNFAAARVLRQHGCSAAFYLTAGCLRGGARIWLHEVTARLRHSRREHLHLAWNGHVLDYGLRSLDEKEAALAGIIRWIKTLTVASRTSFMARLAEALPVEDATWSRPVMLSWDDVREMARMGMTFGGHTLTHCNLVHATSDEVRGEIRDCMEIMRQELGAPPRHFAYPNGGTDAYYDGRSKEEVRLAGFVTSGTSRAGSVSRESDPWDLPRVGVPRSLAELVHSLEWWKARELFRTRWPRFAGHPGD